MWCGGLAYRRFSCCVVGRSVVWLYVGFHLGGTDRAVWLVVWFHARFSGNRFHTRFRKAFMHPATFTFSVAGERGRVSELLETIGQSAVDGRPTEKLTGAK